jgi:hypothetical protein
MVSVTSEPRAQGPVAHLYAVGDIDGPGLDGATTIIRDAIRVGGVGTGVIYAVGGAVTRRTDCGVPGTGPCPGPDTSILWRFNRADATPTLDALPDLVVNTGGTSGLTAFDITPDAAYIASQARSVASGNASAGVRVTRGLPPSTSVNLNLNTLVPGLTNVPGALAVSDNGAIISGFATLPTGPGGANQGNAVRIDTTNATAVVIPRACPTAGTPGCPTADNTSFVVARGSSANGDVAVGTSSNNAVCCQRRAFRYVHGSGMTLIPLLPGGSINSAFAVSPDGDKVLVTGNGDGPIGNAAGVITDEVYVYTASTNSIERLGSPNSDLGPGVRQCFNLPCFGPGSAANILSAPNAGGMTADGAVVAMNFSGANPGESYAYIHNDNGWFHFTSVLAASGVDFHEDGWDFETDFLIYGISPDGTLVFGAGVHNGVVKGFVAEFAPGVLASFNSVAAPPEDPSFVGAWTACFTSCDAANPADVLVFTADGAYFHINGRGFERGHYTYDGSELRVTTLTDTNGGDGLSGDNGLAEPITVEGNVATNVDDVDPMVAGHRIVGGPGSIVGGWVGGTPTVSDTHVLVLAGTRLFEVLDFPDNNGSGRGTYTWDPITHEVVVTFEGEPPEPGNFATPSPDERTLFVQDDGGEEFTLARVIDPRTPAITSALTATATTGLPFAYQIAGTNNPTTFDVVGIDPLGLPAWTFNAGLIQWTPSAPGTFEFRVEARNAISTSTGVNRLLITVIAPVEVELGPAVVTPIPSEEPGEPPPVTIEFTNVTSGGTISVATIDPETVLSAPEPPAGFSLGDDPVYYEITPSAGLTFTGPVEVCFSYAGVTFAGVPRLLHYDVDLASWIDITTSVDVATSTVCGLTSSFSPFAIAASALSAVGFHQPVEPVAGALNTVKGGSTVALKFNVYDASGVEVTNPANIVNPGFVMTRIACETGEPEDTVEAQTTGGTELRYDTTARQFVQNWKTPRTPGACYLVKVTGDGLLISARFKTK